MLQRLSGFEGGLVRPRATYRGKGERLIPMHTQGKTVGTGTGGECAVCKFTIKSRVQQPRERLIGKKKASIWDDGLLTTKGVEGQNGEEKLRGDTQGGRR